MTTAILKNLRAHISDAGFAPQEDGVPDVGLTCAMVLMLESSGELSSIPPGRRSAWAEAIVHEWQVGGGHLVLSSGDGKPVRGDSREAGEVDVDSTFMLLHAVDALARITPEVRRPHIQLPDDAVVVVSGLDWEDTLSSAAFTRCLLLALIQQAELDGDAGAVKQVRGTLNWLAHEQGDGYYLIPDRSGDAVRALVASSYVEPFFAYTFKPTNRNTSRAEAAIALLRRDPLRSNGISREYVALLDLVAAAKLAGSANHDEIDEILATGADTLSAALLPVTDCSPEERRPYQSTQEVTQHWTTAVVLGRIEFVLRGQSSSWQSRRWPAPGLLSHSGVDSESLRASARTWLFPKELQIPHSSRPVVTVVIPCYNLGLYLPEAIESVCEQTFRDVSVVVVNDGSTDGLTRLAFDLLQSAGVKVVSQTNAGLAAARNLGIGAAATPYICCLDPDDRLRPTFLERTIHLLEREPDLAFAGSWVQMFGESDLVLSDIKPQLPDMLAFNQTTCNAVFRKALWREVQGFKPGLSIPGIEVSDWDFWLSLLERDYRGAVIPELLFEYRIRTGSMSERMYTIDRWPELVKELVSRHESLFRSNVEHVTARMHSKWVEQRQWLERRERGLRWWKTQTRHLEDALAMAREALESRETWIAELESAKGWLELQQQNWRQLASAREEEIRELNKRIEELTPSANDSAAGPDQSIVPPALSELIAQNVSIAEGFPEAESRQKALDAFRRRSTPAPMLARSNYKPTKVALLSTACDRVLHPVAPGHVCIATPDISGPVTTGGIGSAYASLAVTLSGAGHQVTILYTRGTYCENGTIQGWIEHYGVRGIEFVPLPELDVPVDGPEELGFSYAAYIWLKTRQFGVIHFPEMYGTGACSVEAKRLGLAFANTTLCVGLHSPTIWNRLENQQTIHRIEDLFLDALERKSVELADVLISPSNYLLSWIDQAGWRRPAETYVHPYAVAEMPQVRQQMGEITEVVFFGRLETRKGLELFCDAIDLLARQDEGRPSEITFLGKSGAVGGTDGVSYIAHRSSKWPMVTTTHADWSRHRALEYLTRRPALAVMPSLSDNTPNTVIECISSGVPFVSTQVGGIPEMMNGMDRLRVLAEPNALSLATSIRTGLSGGYAPASPAIDPSHVNAGWIEWHESVAEPLTASSPEVGRTPLVTVCMATRNRPALLKQAIDSIGAQTYRHLELVVIDDGSDDGSTQQVLEDWRKNHSPVRVHVLTGPQRFPGAARNAAAAHAHGEYMLFMDDDNIACPEEVATLVTAAERAKLDVVTCGFRAFQHLTDQSTQRFGQFLWLPIGPAMPLDLLVNNFGDTNMLVRRDAFFLVGGFDEERGAGLVEDWVFHSRAFLANMRAAAVPEPLFEYRQWPGGTGQSAGPHLSYVRGLQPYLEHLDPSFGLILLYASGAFRADQAPSVAANAQNQALFERARTVAKPTRRDLKLHEQLSWIEEDDSISLLAHRDDPQLLFPELPVHDGSPLLVRIEITPPRFTMLQIFWTADGDPRHYDEKRSTMATVGPRRSAVVLRIPTGALAAPLRLDPGCVRGMYLIHDIEVRQESVATGNSPLPLSFQRTMSPDISVLRRWVGRVKRELARWH